MENIFGKRKSKITKNWRGNSYNSYILQKLSQKLQSYLTLSLGSSKKIKKIHKAIKKQISLRNSYALIMSRTRFRVDPHSIVAWMSRNTLLETHTISEV